MQFAFSTFKLHNFVVIKTYFELYNKVIPGDDENSLHK